MKNQKPLTYLNSIRTIDAPFKLDQREAISWLIRAWDRSSLESDRPDSIRNRVHHLYERFLGNQSIHSRRSVLGDFRRRDFSKMEFFRPSLRRDGTPTLWSSPPLEQRMEIFAKEALAMIQNAFQEVTEPPATLIEVSCTGYDAPYPAQKLVLEKSWQNSSKLLKLGHMGCYASVPAMNLANNLVLSADDDRTVSIFSVEFCSLHLNPAASQADQIVANILFADGAARMDFSRRATRDSFALLGYAECLVPDSAECMTWTLGDSNFHMNLSKKVGIKIGEVLKDQVDQFLQSHKLKQSDIGRFAIHPGGPLIIEMVQRSLELPEESVRHSKAILRDFGNMSSATLPYIWHSMQVDPQVKSGELIVSLAFGPGLTLVINLLGKGL